MARRALSPSQLACVQAVRPVLDELHAEGHRELLVALSGGADSLALAAAVAHCLAPGRGVASTGMTATAVVVDHGLQPGSAAQCARAAGQARALGLDARVHPVRVEPTGQGVEAAAREARLHALTAAGLPVLLGHSLDDQAETVLLGLARGSGAASLQAMAPRRGLLVRPLLGLRRSLLHQACRDWGLQAWSDPMNAERRFRRVAVREQLLPLMDEVLGGQVVEALGRTAELLRADNALLDQLAGQALAGARDGEELRVEAVLALPEALRGRVLRGWMVECGALEPTMGHVRAVEELLLAWRGQRGVDLPGGVRVARRSGRLTTRPDGQGPGVGPAADGRAS